MSVVKFPGLALELKVPEIAFKMFGVDIYYYSLCIVTGIILALMLCRLSQEKFYIKFDCVIEATILSLIVGIFGARLYYVIFNLGYYLSNPTEIFNIRDGGLAIYGGLLAGGYVIIKKCKTYRIKPEEFFDYIAPFVALAQAVGRWGNFFNVEAYGIKSTSFLRMGIETINGYIEVHPVFLYESVATFIIFLWLRHVQKNRKFIGQVFYLYIAMYSGVRMYLEILREDSLMLFDFKVSRVLSILMFVYAACILLKRYIKYAIKEMHKPNLKK